MYNSLMTQVDYLKSEIKALSEKDFAHLRNWIAEQDWQLWDNQLESDIAAGKLDFLKEEAKAAKTQGQLQEL